MRHVTPIMDNWEISFGDRPSQPGKGQRIDLPYDWAIHRPIKHPMDWGVDQAFRDWWGIGWFRKTLTIPHIDATRRYYLDFDGVYENAEVSVNSHPVGKQAYGYSPFRLEITKALHDGPNDLLVKVSNTQWPTDRWYSGAGIYRMVRLMDLPATHFDERAIIVDQPHNPREGQPAKIRVHLENVASLASDGLLRQVNGQPTEAEASIADAQGCTVGQARGSIVNGIDVTIPKARLWSAESPYLYTLTLKTVPRRKPSETSGNKPLEKDSDDEIGMRIGIRKIRFDPSQGMIVNGKKEIFRGVCLHQDAGSLGSASTKSIVRSRLLELKSMGCNGLRLAHHAHPRFMLDLADELGFYVYAEPFDKWESGHYKRYFQKGWNRDLSALIRRDRNRPSVVIWGVGNEVENQAKDSMLAILRMLVARTHQLDPSRPAGCAMSPHFQRDDADTTKNEGIVQATDEGKAGEEITDPDERVSRIARIARITDVTVLNYAEQWYDRIHAAIPDKPLFASEVYQWFQGHELQMQDYLQKNPSLVPVHKPWVIGGSIWAGFDYLGESMGWPSKGWSGALIRTDGRPKAGYWVLRSYWTDKHVNPFVHFMVADYSQPDENVKEHWDIPPFVHHWEFPQIRKRVVPYAVATNCDEIRIFDGGRQIYVPPVNSFPNHVITGYLPYFPGHLQVIGLVDSRKVCEDNLQTPVSAACSLEFYDPVSGRKLPEIVDISPADGGEKLLNVRSVDREGHPVFNEFSPTRFLVSSGAQLESVDSGCLLGNDPYDGDSTHLWQGAAACVIKVRKPEGRITVEANSPGMLMARQVLVVGKDR